MNQISKPIRIMIIGAGKAGSLVSRDIINNNPTFKVVGFLDDAKDIDEINGVPILGTITDVASIVVEKDIDEILIAIPSGRGEIVRQIVDDTAGTKLSYKILPTNPQVLITDFESNYMDYVRDLRIEDMLGGQILKSDQEEISSFAKDKTIMVTGAAGSIGSELSKQLVAHGAKKVIFYDWWENGMFDLKNRLQHVASDTEVHYVIGDVKDARRLAHIMGRHKPDTVFHAAAYKHVPLMESNATEAIKNNILGTKLVATQAIENGVENFILISTDKAVNPTNIMGATKRAAEKTIHILSKNQNTTSFCAVRFGNVINSNGSVIPTFMRQIAGGGPVTVTHKDVNRFFMTIPEAVHLILQSWVMGENNDLFVLDMGQPIKIYDLAKSLISLKGYIPEEEIKIEFTGLRPGEKLYEEVLKQEEEVSSTQHDKIFRTKNFMNFDKDRFLTTLDLMLDSIQNGESVETKHIKHYLQTMISTYAPKDIEA